MSEARVVVDASVVVSFVIPQDVNSSKAREWFSHALSQETTLLAPSLLLLEVASAMTRRAMDSASIDKVLTWIEQAFELTTSSEVEKEALSIVRSQGLRAMDAHYVALAASLKTALVSFDREQIEKARAMKHEANEP